MAKKYIPSEKEKYMCEKHKTYFKKRLIEWKNEILDLNTKGLYLKDIDHEISSPDIVDQAASQTEKTVEMRTLNRQIKLLSKIDKAIKRIEDNSYGYCEDTGEPIGLKRLIARIIDGFLGFVAIVIPFGVIAIISGAGEAVIGAIIGGI